MSDAYVETTVLTNCLLKVGSKKQTEAKAALKRYSRTLLPVYAIREWKAGPLQTFAWVHDKLVQTKSLRNAFSAIEAISPYKKYFKNTALEAWAAAGQAEGKLPSSFKLTGDSDRDLADRYRLALHSIIVRSWRQRRSVTDETVDDLDCYTETEPRLDDSGLLDMTPTKCEPEHDCFLKQALTLGPELLVAMRDAIPETSSRPEDVERRKVLKTLINTPKFPMREDACRRLGDAVFAFFCPKNAVVLTTNLKDLKPLANAIGKDAEKP